MKKILILSFLTLISVGCRSAADSNAAVQNSAANTAIVSSHSTNASIVASPRGDKTSASESSPMAKPVDVEEMSREIERAEKEYKKNPKAKDELSKAYFARAFALTEAAQYRAALGDFRKGLKLNPKDEDARKMHDEILRIFQSINREPPKEGEEPPPLPLK